MDGGGATGGDACGAGVAKGVATGCVASQCVVEDAIASRCVTLQRVAPDAPATGFVAGECVEPVPAVGAAGGRLALGDGLAGIPGCAGLAPPARLGGDGLTVVAAPALTSAAVGAACGTGWPGAAEPVARAPTPGASFMDEAGPLPTTAGEAVAPFGAGARTTVRAVAAPADPPHSTAIVIPIAPKE